MMLSCSLKLSSSLQSLEFELDMPIHTEVDS
jgi:hypothetical protein